MEQKSKYIFYLEPDYENFVPRKTRLKYSTVGIGIPATLFLLALGIFGGFFAWIFISMAYEGLRDYWRFEIKGLETQATITACELVRQSEKTNRLNVSYIYIVDGVEYSAHDDVIKGHAHCREFPSETQINIEYNKANPHYSRIVADNWIIFICGTPLVIFGILLFLTGAVGGIGFTLFEINARYKYHHLRKSGILLEGEVVKSEYKTEQSKRGAYYVLHVKSEFETPDGRVLTRTFRGKAEDSTSRAIPPAGTRVMLLYANDRAVILL